MKYKTLEEAARRAADGSTVEVGGMQFRVHSERRGDAWRIIDGVSFVRIERNKRKWNVDN